MTEFQPLVELERLLGHSGTSPTTIFPPNSRYVRTEIATLKDSEGVETPYLRRRFVPAPESFGIAMEKTIQEGDRLDNVAARVIGDPEMFWMLCDANRALHPRELEVVGRTIVAPLPQGTPAFKAIS